MFILFSNKIWMNIKFLNCVPRFIISNESKQTKFLNGRVSVFVENFLNSISSFFLQDAY